MTNNTKLLILAAVGVGAYIYFTKPGAYGAPRPGGAYSPIYPAGYGAPTAPNTPKAQLNALNNSTLYGVGRLINGIFGGSAGTSGGAPLGTQPSAVAIGSGGGQWRPSTYDNAPAATYYTPGTYSVNPNSWGPTQPDAFAVNPSGGYEIYTPGSYTVDPNAWGPPNPANYDAYDYQ